jgi:hypothetical protein
MTEAQKLEDATINACDRPRREASGLWPYLRGHAVPLLLPTLFAFYLWMALLWHAIDRQPPRWDESHSLAISQHSYHALQQGDVLTALSLKGVSNTKPGLVPFFSALTYFLLGDSPGLATILVNAAAMLVILYVLLRAGEDLFGCGAIGAVAFLVFNNLRGVLVWTGYYQPEFVATASVTATIWLCWTIDRQDFAGRRLPLLLAVSIVFGLGSKHLYPVFVGGPLALLVGRALVPSCRPFRISFRRRGYLLACMAVGLALGLLYHVLNLHIIREQFARSQDAALTGGIGRATAAWPVFVQFMDILPTSVLCVLTAASSALALALKRWRVVYVLLGVIGGYFGVSRAASWPVPYYFMPFVPLGLVVAGGFLGLLPRTQGPAGKVLRAGRNVVLAGLVAVLLAQYSQSRLGTRNLVRVVRQTPRILASYGNWTENPVADEPYWRQSYVDGNVATLPYPHEWHVRDMFDAIRDSAGEFSVRRPLVVLYFTGAFEWMSDEYARYQIKRMGLGGTVQLTQLFTFAADKTPSQVLADYDFVIMKTGRAMKEDFYEASWAEGYQAFVDRLAANGYAVMRESGFRLVRRYDLPDGGEGSLWLSSQRAAEVK